MEKIKNHKIKGNRVKRKKNETDSFVGFIGSPELQFELTGPSPRASAIVGAAALEIKLDRLLSSFLIEDRTGVDNFINSDKNPNAPLGNFASKIRACYCLGLISKNEFEDLEKVREIRNIFAHHLKDCSFEEEYVKQLCSDFEIIKKANAFSFSTRQKFNIVIYGLEHMLSFRAERVEKRLVVKESIFDNNK